MKDYLKKAMQGGLWIQPICFIAMLNIAYSANHDNLLSLGTWIASFVFSFVPILLIMMEKMNKPSSENARGEHEKKRAMYPDVPQELLFDTPTGIMFGMWKGKYVCLDISRYDGHQFIIGGSGSGKSSTLLINTILANPDARIMALDIKGELSYKAKKLTDDRLVIFNPQDRNAWGYNPLYALHEDSTMQEILEVMQTITFSLISMSASSDGDFWKQSARNYLLGLLLYFYNTKEMHDFIQIVDAMFSKSASELVAEVMEQADPSSLEYKYMVGFSTMEDVTLGGIVGEVNSHILIFSTDEDIRYAFRYNDRKASPQMLEDGYSIFLSIREEKLSAYNNILQLIINQTLSTLETRQEDSEPILFLIDELGRICSEGRITKLQDALRTLRSRKVRCILATQSIEGLRNSYSEDEIWDMVSNCNYISVLSATSIKTQEAVCKWCGRYEVRKKSWSGEGKERKSNVSFDKEDIVEPSDLITLPMTGEAILINPFSGYCRIKKSPYYKDRYFRPMADEIRKYNDDVMEIRKGE